SCWRIVIIKVIDVIPCDYRPVLMTVENGVELVAAEPGSEPREVSEGLKWLGFLILGHRKQMVMKRDDAQLVFNLMAAQLVRQKLELLLRDPCGVVSVFHPVCLDSNPTPVSAVDRSYHAVVQL